MGLFTGSDGSISLVRASLTIVALGAILIGIGIASFVADTNSRREPMNIALPDGAETWGGVDSRGPGWQFVYYRVPGGDLDALASFYDQEMIDHYGNANDPQRERCVRFPTVGSFPDFDLEAGLIPFYWSCMFDRSGLSSTQWTQVRLQPGIPNEDPLLSSEGYAVIVYEQRWTP